MTGVFSMVPYLFLTIMTLVSGPIADLLRARWFSTTLVRKMFTTFGGSTCTPKNCVIVHETYALILN